MKVNLDGWVVESDKFCYTLSKKMIYENGNNKGKSYEVPEGYYTKIEHVLDALLEKEIKNSKAKSLTQLKKDIKKPKRKSMSAARQ